MFKNKTLLITGGTGSFGNAVLPSFLKTDIKEVRIFSRDEQKQDDMRSKYRSKKIKFFIGDIRERSSIANAAHGVDYIFHAAALKQVPSCEFHPLEATRTNILGTENVLDVAIDLKIKKVVCLSTDKAVYPVNAMGMSKALMEKVAVSKARNSKNTIISITRYGNVMGSRGSVIPLFVDQIMNNEPITITDPKMTRFMMSLDDAVNLVLFAFKNASSGELFIQKSPATSILVLAQALCKIFDRPCNMRYIGIRHGEKKFETLLSKEEMAFAKDLGDYFSLKPDNRDLNYSIYIDKGLKEISKAPEYNSLNTKLLNVSQMCKLLKNLSYIKKMILV